jgi:hypothetical protein
MKVELITHKYEDGKVYAVGYTMVAESDDEKGIVNTIRNINFFGSPRYNGRRRGNDTDDAGLLSWVEEEFKSNRFKLNLETNMMEPRDEEDIL